MGIACYSNPKEIDKQNSTEIVANDSSTIFHLFAGYNKSNESCGKTNPSAWPKAVKHRSNLQVTLEPPAGLKAGLYRTYSTMVSQELLDKTLGTKGAELEGLRGTPKKVEKSCLYSGRLVDCYNPRVFLF